MSREPAVQRYKSQLQRAVLELKRGRFPEAARAAEAAVALRPDLGIGWRVRGEALQAAGDLAGAVSSLRESVRLEPYTPAAHAALGSALQAQGKVDEPMRCFAEAMRLGPADAQVMVRAGHFLLERGQLDEAEGVFRAAIALAPRPGAVAGLAGVLERRGLLDEAAALLRRFEAAIPQSAPLVLVAARVMRRRGRAAEALPLVEAALADRPGRELRVALLHALADLRDALGEVDGAFAAWRRAKALRGLRLDRRAFQERIDGLIARWPCGAAPVAERDERPVLIVGMPRSGTSLVEQIIASHSAAAGAGERDELPQLIAGLPGEPARWTRAAVDGAARHYLGCLGRAGPGAARVTDKLPQNFLSLGAAAHLLPGARVIHCRRDPVDTCFSCFRQNFHATHPWATSLEDLGLYWRGYSRLMAHWRRCEPLPMLEVDYERLVAEPEPVVREILGFLGLAWEPACLDFHRSRRVVNTASYAQVQRPIYTSSVGRSRPYAAHLGPLVAALDRERGASAA